MDNLAGDDDEYPSDIIRELATGDADWSDLWDSLHHQGDVGEGSYEAVPYMVRIAKSRPDRDWNLYALVATIEVQRHCKKNPPLPGRARTLYRQALHDLMEMAIHDLPTASDPSSVQAMLAAIALAKGHVKLGALIINTEASEMTEILDHYDGWSQLYSERPI